MYPLYPIHSFSFVFIFIFLYFFLQFVSRAGEKEQFMTSVVRTRFAKKEIRTIGWQQQHAETVVGSENTLRLREKKVLQKWLLKRQK